MGQRQARRDGARRVRRRAADVRRVHDPRAGATSRSRWCSCTAAAGRAPTGWARPTDVPAGSSIWCRKATRCTSSIGRDTGARRCIPTCTAASRSTPMMLESLAGRFTPPSANPDSRRRTSIRRTTPSGPVRATSARPISTSSCAGLGGSYVQQPPPPGAAPGGGRQGGRWRWRGGAGRRCGAGGPPPPANTQPAVSAQRAAPGLASGRRRAARQDRSGDHHDALGRRALRPARRRGAARTS